MSKLHVELNQETVTNLVVKYLSDLLNTTLTKEDINIEVKSKQNFRAEWEKAEFRARVDKVL